MHFKDIEFAKMLIKDELNFNMTDQQVLMQVDEFFRFNDIPHNVERSQVEGLIKAYLDGEDLGFYGIESLK